MLDKPTTPLRTVIIDDEIDCVSVVKKLITLHCPELAVVATSTDSVEAVNILLRLRPDVVLLDIEMPIMNGFQILEEIGEFNFQLVFTTAYDRYAVKAFKYSAIDYLLKPIDPIELKATVQKVLQKQRIDQQQLDLLRRQLYSPQQSAMSEKLALPYQQGYIFIDVNDIIFAEADDCYARIHLTTGEVHLITKTLGELEQTLDNQHFFRIHRQYLVNRTKVKRYNKADNHIFMSNDNVLPIARSRRDGFGKVFLKLNG
jgi:two-component system, LytTR family, response regulator